MLFILLIISWKWFLIWLDTGKMDTLFLHSCKGDNFYDLLFAFLYIKKWVYSNGKELINLNGQETQSFLTELPPFQPNPSPLKDFLRPWTWWDLTVLLHCFVSKIHVILVPTFLLKVKVKYGYFMQPHYISSCNAIMCAVPKLQQQVYNSCYVH